LAAIEREERGSEGEFFIRVCGVPVLGISTFEFTVRQYGASVGLAFFRLKEFSSDAVLE
jgi:hypothetical protein